jgi:hypothetical protein
VIAIAIVSVVMSMTVPGPQVDFMAGILAGETVPNCPTCDHWIACTLADDLNRYPDAYALHPGRWHGYKRPQRHHVRAMEMALAPGGCADVPTCQFLGNLRDYTHTWAPGLASERPSHVVGNQHGAIVCIPPWPERPSPRTEVQLLTTGLQP